MDFVRCMSARWRFFVAIAFVAASSSRHLSRKVTLVLVRGVCPQYKKGARNLAESLVGDSSLAPWNPY